MTDSQVKVPMYSASKRLVLPHTVMLFWFAAHFEWAKTQHTCPYSTWLLPLLDEELASGHYPLTALALLS